MRLILIGLSLLASGCVSVCHTVKVPYYDNFKPDGSFSTSEWNVKTCHPRVTFRWHAPAKD